MEQIVFPVPNICEFLTAESKINVYQTCERDDQNSKVTLFFCFVFVFVFFFWSFLFLETWICIFASFARISWPFKRLEF